MTINIGNISLMIDTNSPDIHRDIHAPSAHSLHTNWIYQTNNLTGLQSRIYIEKNSKNISALLDKETLYIEGDFSHMQGSGFNPQFGIAGNKGIISKYISHICELYDIVSFHACALYHPGTGKILIGIGASGSGKTAFISSGIQLGWQIIATEMLQIGINGNILPGNTFDTIGKNAIQFFQQNPELNVEIFEQDRIFDQTGYKCLGDFSQYQVNNGKSFHIQDAEIVFLQFGNKEFANGENVTDTDMALRFIGHSASEKIEAPTYIGNNLGLISLYGNPKMRNSVIHMLNSKIRTQTILGGNMENFQDFLINRKHSS